MDFSNRQNRLVRLSEVSQSYLDKIKNLAQSDPYYPSYHIAPPHGLLNDPNGLSFFNGEHHLFYQWFPLGPVHGLKHWYHVSTQDFVHFYDHGVAMWPDQEYDLQGCYTGVALAKQEELHLYYTANRIDQMGEIHQTQAFAVMNKQGEVSKKGVLVEENREHYTHEFRDPIILEQNDQYYMLVGAQGVDGKGKLAAYHNFRNDGFVHLGNIDIGLEDFGYMWECPNYFEQDDLGIFIFSPQGVASDSKYDLNNVFSVVYMIGNPIDFNSCTYTHTGWHELDKGFDFYAPQTYLDEQGRRILLGWLGNSKSEYPTDKNYWAHMLTIPRQLTVEGKYLLQQPLTELTALRQTSLPLTPKQRLISPAFELELEVKGEFCVLFGNDLQECLQFSGSSSEFCLDRSNVSQLHAEQFGTVRYAKRAQDEQVIRIFVDHSSIEIFADNGRTVFTSRLFVQDLSQLRIANASGVIHYLAPIQLSSS